MITEQNKEAVEVLLANRYYIYTLLHKALSIEPTIELLEVLTSPETAEAFALLSESEDDIMARAGKFFAEVRKDMSDPGFVNQAKDEFTRLFVGPIKLIAPPWESVYRGKEGMLFQECTLEVREFYRSFGYLPQAYPRVADDSLALELAFMSKLAGKALEGFKSGDMAETKHCLGGAGLFLNAHLLVWIPRFMEKMKLSPSDYLYPQLCLIMEEFINIDKSTLRELHTVLEDNTEEA